MLSVTLILCNVPKLSPNRILVNVLAHAGMGGSDRATALSFFSRSAINTAEMRWR